MTAPLSEPDATRLPARRRRRPIALLALLILAVPAAWGARLAATKMEYFHLRHVTVEGTRYLAPERVMEVLALDTMRSVLDETGTLTEKLTRLSQVSEVRISRRLPGTLVISISENLPVALAPSPRGLEVVDTAGTSLPVDPSREDVDVPLVHARDTMILRLLGDVRSRDPMLYRRISEIFREGRNSLTIRLKPLVASAVLDQAATADSTVSRASETLLVRVPLGVSVTRLADIFPVESDLVRRHASVAELDLRYRDQVIARLQ